MSEGRDGGRRDGAGRYGNRRLQGLVLLGTLLVLLLGGAGPASAHAALRSTDPADGTVLESAPRDLTLTFTESVGLLDDSFRVFDPENRRVRTGEAAHAGGRSDTARVTLPAGLGEGTFTVAWRVVSADSHPVAGAFTFSVGKPTPTAVALPTGQVEDPATAGLHNIVRYAAYSAAALLIGTVAFVLLCRPPHPGLVRKPLVVGWWTLLASTLLLLLLRAPYEAGTGLATAFDLSALERTLTGRPGLALLARLVLLGVAAVLLLRARRKEPSRVTLVCGAVLAVGLALTWAAAEHASAGIQVPVAMTSSVLHLLAVALWLGGLAALLTLLYGTDDVPAAVVARFSRLAFTSVTVLVVTGVYQSWRSLGSWDALTGTTYGRLLLVKLAAVTLLLAAAGLSRRWTARLVTTETTEVRERVREMAGGPPLPDPERDPDPESQSAPQGASQRGLRRAVLAEVTVGVAVLVLSTVLSGTLPGRAEAEAAEGAAATGIPTTSVTVVPFDVGTPNGQGKVQVTLDPGRVGDNSLEAVVFGPDGGLVAIPELRVSFTLPDEKIGPLDAKVADKGGYWAADSFSLPLPGTWTMKVTVRVSDVDQVSETRKVRIER